MTIRSILNRIFWNQRINKGEYEVTFIHRGVYMNRKVIRGNLIKDVKASFFCVQIDDKESVIPFHRILEIKNVKNGKED